MARMTRRNIIALMVGTGATSILAACTTNQVPAAPPQTAPTAAPNSNGPNQAAGPTPTAAVQSQTAGFSLSAPQFNANARTVLVFLNAGTSQVESTHQNKWVQQWNTQNPDIQVDLQYVAWADLNTKTQAYLAAGTPPDCSWYCFGLAQEAYAKGWIEPLDTYLADVKGTFNPLLFAPGSNSMTPDGQNWLGVPFCMYGEGLVVRKDYFQSAGVTDLSTLATWDGFKSAVSRIANPPKLYGYEFPQDPSVLTYTASRFFLANGLEHLADFRPAKKDAYIQVLDYIKQLLQFSPDAAKAWNHGGEIAAWTAGNIASMGTGSYFFGDIIPTAPDIATADKMAALPFPAGPQLSKPVNSLGFCGYMLFKDSQHKAETAQFMKFMGSSAINAEFPMNLDPSKSVNIDQRVQAYRVYSPDHYQQDGWWQQAWIAITDPKNVDQKFASGYIPSAEIDHAWQNVFPSWAFGNTSTSAAYDQLHAQIGPLLQNPPT